MATAAGGGGGGLYEGGAGGKFRKKPYRRPSTPYERPSTVIRNPIEAAAAAAAGGGGRNNNGWISKFVDPASRIITRSAQRFFASVFRKNLPAPPPPPSPQSPMVTEANHVVANHESRDQQEVDLINPSSGPHENEIVTTNNDSCTNGINELEIILSRKNFTRAEIDRLTELLHSKTVDASADHEMKRSEPSTSQMATAHDRLEFANMPVQENLFETQKFHGGISVPAISSSVHEQDVASPAELAKAYMGKRPSKVSPSSLGLRSQPFREDVPLLSNIPFTPKSPSMSLGPRSAVRFAGVSENGYLTPRPRGRSAIYSMARTPYTRVPNAGTMKIDGHANPSTSSQWPWENTTISGSKQVMKRRISVLDNDIGSVGPIRRIRQKTNLMTPSRNIPPTANGSSAAQDSMSSKQKHLLVDEFKHNASNLRNTENSRHSIPSSSSSVPAQSTEMAQKIREQLDKLVPSPKQKSSELRLADARDKSPAKLTLDMLQGQALRSVGNVDSPMLPQNVKHQGSLDGLCSTSEPGARGSTSQKQDKVDENGPLKNATFGQKLSSEANGVERTMLVKDTMPSSKISDPEAPNFVASRPQKRAFQMSAHEDFLDLDDDSYNEKAAPSPATAEKGKLITSVAESSMNVAEKVMMEKPSVFLSERIPTASFSFNKSIDTVAPNGPAAVKKDPGFCFSISPAPSTITVSATPASQPVLPLEAAASPKEQAIASPREQAAAAPREQAVASPREPFAAAPKEQSAAPMFSFGSKSVEKSSPFESSVAVFGAQSDSKLVTPSSTATWSATVTETTPKIPEADTDRTHKAVDFSKHPENAAFSPISAPATPSIFSFGASTNNSSLSNGSLPSTTSIFSIPAITPASNTSTGEISSSTTTTNASASGTANNGQSVTPAATTFSAAPFFQFGSSSSAAAVSSSSASLPLLTSGVESTDSEQKKKQASPFGNLTTTFGASPSPFTTTGSSVFGFGAAAPSSTKNPFANNQSQGSNPFGAASGSLFGGQSAPAETGTGVASFTQSMPSQVGSSSASTPTFGLNGSSTLSSGNSLFGSAAPAGLQFGSSSFGQSTSTLGTGAFNSGTTATSLFGSSSQSSPTSIFSSSGFGSSSSPAAGFSFGASAAAPAASSAPVTFGSSLGTSSGGAIFSFGAATASSTSLAPSSSVFGTQNQVMPFGSASPSNDQMNMEDSMAEDTVQASAPVTSPFGQPTNSPSPSHFMFSSPAPPPGASNLFQFSGQQNSLTPQNPPQFQPSGVSAGGSFSLGTGDKSTRKIVKAKRDKSRKR